MMVGFVNSFRFLMTLAHLLASVQKMMKPFPTAPRVWSCSLQEQSIKGFIQRLELQGWISLKTFVGDIKHNKVCTVYHELIAWMMKKNKVIVSMFTC